MFASAANSEMFLLRQRGIVSAFFSGVPLLFDVGFSWLSCKLQRQVSHVSMTANRII
ncbi:hypothetical protein CCMA1212_002098 [Trichoderma ghanense]|uniref:Uncharacterized protein n=1 Tax=Trichoderma ghanense TaxID=65468 RepID=A0ABY2HG51_9HYPO